MQPGWQKVATDDEAIIRKWWKASPQANIGLATGEVSDLLVLDIDGADGESTVSAKGHDSTVVVITGKGRQLYFRHPGEKTKNKVGAWPQIDARGVGGYVVAPGSTHYTGKIYQFDKDFHPDKTKLALAPQWFLEEVLESASKSKDKSAPTEAPKKVTKGGRNSTLASMAGVLRDRGLSVDAIKYSLLDYNRNHCTPPLEEEEVETISNSYGRYAAGDPNKKFKVSELVDVLKANRYFITTPIDSGGCGVKLMLYSEGAYRPNGSDIARRIADKTLGKASRPDTINSIVDLIRERTKISEEFLNPRAMQLINTINGMLEWKTGKLHPHSHELLSTFQFQAVYDPSVKSELLDTFLEQVLPADAIPLMEEFLGYLLLPTAKYQKACMLIGEGANGKSTFLQLLSYFLNELNISRLSLQQLEDSPFSVAELQGKLANIYSDLPSSKLEKSDIFKSIVGGDQIKAEKKFGHPFTLRTFAKLIFSANEFPRSADSSQAYFRRWLIISFPNKFEGSKADPDLGTKLTQPSVMSALLNKALIGLKRLEAQGSFSATESADRQAEVYRTENNSSYAYARECLKDADAKHAIGKVELYAAYAQWCVENGVKFPENTRRFNKSIELSMKATEIQVGPRRTKSWAGIAYQDTAVRQTAESRY